MSSGFDPCKQWLGIDALSLGDPWLVLGVARGETNPLAIVRAADAKLTILRGVPAGPLSIARDALVKRVEAARDELLASAAQAIQTAQPPLAPPTLAAPPPRPTYAPPPVPMAPPVPQMPAPSEQAPVVRLSKQPVARQSSVGPAVVAVISILAVVAAAYVASQVLERRKQETRRKPDEVAVVPKPTSTGKDRQPDRQPETKQPDMKQPEGKQPEAKQPASSAPGDAAESAVDVSMPAKGKRPAEAAGEVTPKDPPPSEDPAASPSRGRKPQDNGRPADDPASEPRPEPRPEEPDAKPKPDAPAPDEDPEMRSKPKPGSRPDAEPEPDVAPSSPKPTAVPEPEDTDAATAVTKLLREAYAALGENEFETAKAALKTAVAKADGDDKLSLRVNCFRQLAQYAEQFIGYRDEAFKAAADGGIYELSGGRMLSIVEISDEELVYKAGTNKRIPRDEIPPAWMQAIITKWFAGEDKPGNHVFLGVYHVVKEKPDLEGAENEWRLAEFGGENVSFLTPLLRDPIIVAKVKDAN